MVFVLPVNLDLLTCFNYSNFNLLAKGVSSSSSSGFFVSLIEEAKELGDENPMLCIETSEQYVIG